MEEDGLSEEDAELDGDDETDEDTELETDEEIELETDEDGDPVDGLI